MPNMCGRKEPCHFSALWLTRSVLLGQSELHLAVLHHIKKTTQRSPKFFFQLPQTSNNLQLELLVKLSTRIHRTVTVVKAFMLVLPSSPHRKLMSRWSFHTRLALGPYFISPSTLRFSRDLNYPTSFKEFAFSSNNSTIWYNSFRCRSIQ